MMMQQPKNTTSEMLEAINFPKKGEVLQGVKVLSSKASYDNDTLNYEIILPKGTKTKSVPKILRLFFSTQVISTAGNLVVKHHDYTVSPSNGNVCVKGSMHIASVVRMNPSMQEFDEEYSSMEMTNPETYFKKYEYKGFNSPQFRAKLFSMVSYMGENYGYCDDKCIYHRRASLIMPKIKITKAVPAAKMMYHTHPKKDEPSLSSADDYLIYMDLSHEPRSIRHFCTVMEDRMDHFEIKPKKGSKQNFLKLDEDKIIEEIDAKISDLEKKWDAKMPKEGASKEDNLRYCENITRDLVKWMNTKYGKYFSFKYKCHYRVKKNPPEPTADDLHLKDEFLQKAVSDTRTRTYGWPEFDTGKMPHENYAYWHQAYYTQHVKDSFMTLGVTPKGANQRRYSQYMNKRFEGTTFTNLDALNMLNLAYDIAAQDAKIRDGNGFKSRMVDLCEYMELSEEACETLVLLEEVIHQSDVFSEQAQTLAGDYYALVLLSYYSISAVHTIERVKKGEIDPDMAKFEVYSKLKQEISDALSSFLTSHESLFEKGFIDSYLNPPRMTLKRTDYLTKFPVEALELYDLVAEALEPFSKTRYDPKRPFYTDKSKFNLWVQTKGGRVGMMISQFTGSVEVTATTENPMEDAMEAVDKVGQALYRAGLPVDPEEFGLMLSEGAMNPQRSQVIILSGPSGSGKSTTIRNLLKGLPNARTAPTITTRRKRKSDKPGERVFVGKGEFLHMVSQGDLVAVQLQKSGDYYAKRLSDFEKEGYVVIEVSLNGLNQMKKIFPSAYTVYLEPVDDPEMIRKRLLRRGDMSAKEAKGRAAIIPQHIAASKKMDFDLRIPMKQGEFDVAAKKIIEMVPKKNPLRGTRALRFDDAMSKGIIEPRRGGGRYSEFTAVWATAGETKEDAKLALYYALPDPDEGDEERAKIPLVHYILETDDMVYQWDTKVVDGKNVEDIGGKKYQIAGGAVGRKVGAGAVRFPNGVKAEDTVEVWRGQSYYQWKESNPKKTLRDRLDRFGVSDEDLEDRADMYDSWSYKRAQAKSFYQAFRKFKKAMKLKPRRFIHGKARAAAKEKEKQATIEEIRPKSIVWDYTKRGFGFGMTDEYEVKDIPVELLEKAFQKSPMYVPPNSGGKVEGVAVAAYQGTPLPVLQGDFVGEAFEFTDGRHRFAYTRDNTNDTTVPVAVYAVKENPAKDLFDWFEEWAKLINMKNKELEAFLDSDWGKVAGLSKKEAKDWNNIKSGRVSGRRIIEMRKKIGLGGPKDYIKNGPRIIESYYEKALNNWTGPSDDPMRGETDWDWCKRQVRFNKRAGAFPYNPNAEEAKGPLVKKFKTYNRPSRRLLSLWVWGHDPWRWARKNGFERMSPCPNVPWIGMTEKKKWGKIEVEMSPRKKNPRTPGGKKFPTKYLSGLTSEEKAIAIKEIDAGYKYDINDPKAYEYWKSDIKATARGYETVPSKYKKKFIEMYGPLPEKGDFITKMSKATGIKKSILQKVYDKGLAAWRVGHRPGVQQHQWAAGRVYSFVTLGNAVIKDGKKMADHSLAVEAGLVKENPSLSYDLMAHVNDRHIKKMEQKLFPAKQRNWDKLSKERQEKDLAKAKQYRKDLEYAYGWKGRGAKSAIEAILTDYANSFDKNGYAKVYRGMITLPSENLQAVWDKYGIGYSWSAYKEGADDYVWTPIYNMPGAVLVLVEGKVHITEVSPPDSQLSLRIGYPLEKEIELSDEIEVTKYSLWSIDPEARVKKPKWSTTGKNWKPWLRRGAKPLKVVEVNERFDAYKAISDPTPLNNPSNEYYAIIDGKPVYLEKENPSEAPGNRVFNEPLPEAIEVAKAYMKSIGKPFKTTVSITEVNEPLLRKMAVAYEKTPDGYNDPEVIESYEAFIKETEAQFLAIQAAGYVVEIDDDDPYRSSHDMIEDLRNNKRLKVFSAESGFGSEPITEEQRKKHALLRQTKYQDVNGQPLLVEEIFRFTHDFFGHAMKGNGFGPIGEENAWSSHSMMYSPLARPAMTTETRAQFAWTFYSGANDKVSKARKLAKKLRAEGKMEEAAKVSEQVHDKFLFPEQKMILLPKEFTTNDYPLANPSEWRHGEFAEDDPFEEYF